jgi:SAM-dependent methyltransferase
LDVGCGNGWSSATLSATPLSPVTALEIKSEELNHAIRVFGKNDNIEFFNCSIKDELIHSRQFDIIDFAASIQYFPFLKKIIAGAKGHLRSGGEIHILDTHFYVAKELNAARTRSKEHFISLGFPEMAAQYFHHSFEELNSFNYQVLYDPNSIINRLKKNRNPFYWICIKDNV